MQGKVSIKQTSWRAQRQSKRRYEGKEISKWQHFTWTRAEFAAIVCTVRTAASQLVLHVFYLWHQKATKCVQCSQFSSCARATFQSGVCAIFFFKFIETYANISSTSLFSINFFWVFSSKGISLIFFIKLWRKRSFYSQWCEFQFSFLRNYENLQFVHIANKVIIKDKVHWRMKRF